MLPVQLHISGVIAQKQSLQSIAEQTVSTARTKIQELKAENPDRRLILIGMNSASALALQVALVEQVSGVVCFGFSYNTVHGVRGQADDHLLDIAAPILFLIGQNAARSNEEEIEFFREKLSAPSTTCVVGAADDYLRVSKTKRRLEGVTQEMVDNMIVDEISDFATKCLQRPLPPKPKSAMAPNITIRREIDSSTGQVRKRKTSAAQDGDSGKSMPKAQKIMRPTSTSDDVLELAVQSILPDHEDKIPITTIKQPATQKFVSRVMPTTQRMKVLGQQPQFKPQTGGQTKFITISGQKAHKNIVTNVQSRPATPNQQQFFLTNRVSNVNKPAQQNFSPTKYTIVRTTSGNNTTQNVSYVAETSTSDLAAANIFDMPIVFADNEGNIDEDVSDTGSVISINSDSPPRVTKQVVIKTSIASTSTATSNFTITKNKNILIQKPTTGKMFMLNGQVIGKQVSATNIMLPKTHLPQQIKVQKFTTATTSFKPTQPSKKIEILNNTIIKPATGVSKLPTTSFVNLADAKQISGARLSLPLANAKNQIVIKTNSLKPYTGAQIVGSNISGNKQLGNLTVKRLNVVPSAAISKVFKKN